MKTLFFVSALGLACLLWTFTGYASQPVITQAATNVPPSAAQVVRLVEGKLASVKGYTADVETQGLDPNGGFDAFRDEQTVWCPDKMRLKRKVLRAHNADAVGETITIVIDGTWLYARTERPPLSGAEAKRYEQTMTQAMTNRSKEEREQLAAE